MILRNNKFEDESLIRKMQTAAGGPIHYSRTMTADNLSKAANYVGEYILKGLGAFGKIMTAPLTGGPLSTATVVLPKTKELLDVERKIKETQELLIGRASTWISPLNYGAALVTGNGLNARKGEEEVASWSPAWQTVGRLGELYVGPKVVKGVKSALNTIVKPAARTIIKNNGAEQYALRDNTGGNSKITVSDVHKALIEAEKYKGSKGYEDLVYRAQKEAEGMGLSFSPDLYIGVNHYFPSIKLNSRPEGKLGGYRKATNTIELDPDQLSPVEAKWVPFHEGMHWLKVGTPERNSPLYNRWKENMNDDLAWHEFFNSEEYKNLAYEDNAKAYARKKVKDALYETADSYLSIPGELLANGLEAGRAIGLEPFAEYPGYIKALEAVEKAREYNKYLYDVRAGTALEVENFWKILTGNYLPTVSIPLTTGYTLYNIFNKPLQQTQYLKQGGRIHIKKENRGKFTDYCGGNVTSACIAKAKASGNPTLIKRATFAANARKWKHLQGGTITNYEKDWSDKLEPYAAGLGLAGDAVGLGAAATGVGIPIGTAIAGFANIPNLIIDGYQTARDTWRSFNDGGNSLGSAAWNSGEFLLDAAGLKALQYINKARRAGIVPSKKLTTGEKTAYSYHRVGTGVGRQLNKQSARRKFKYNEGRQKALKESNEYLAKRGVRETQGEYYYRKLADEMAKRGYGVAVNDAIKSANRTVRQNLAAISTVSGGTNVYHILPKHKNGGFIRKLI